MTDDTKTQPDAALSREMANVYHFLIDADVRGLGGYQLNFGHELVELIVRYGDQRAAEADTRRTREIAARGCWVCAGGSDTFYHGVSVHTLGAKSYWGHVRFDGGGLAFRCKVEFVWGPVADEVTDD